MSKLPVQHRPRSFFPELSEIFEGFPSWASFGRCSVVTSFESKTR